MRASGSKSVQTYITTLCLYSQPQLFRILLLSLNKATNEQLQLWIPFSRIFVDELLSDVQTANGKSSPEPEKENFSLGKRRREIPQVVENLLF